MLEDVSEWNIRLGQQKVIFENIMVKAQMLDGNKETQKKELKIQRWQEKIQKKKRELPDFSLGADGILRFRTKLWCQGMKN